MPSDYNSIIYGSTEIGRVFQGSQLLWAAPSLEVTNIWSVEALSDGPLHLWDLTETSGTVLANQGSSEADGLITGGNLNVTLEGTNLGGWVGDSNADEFAVLLDGTPHIPAPRTIESWVDIADAATGAVIWSFDSGPRTGSEGVFHGTAQVYASGGSSFWFYESRSNPNGVTFAASVGAYELTTGVHQFIFIEREDETVDFFLDGEFVDSQPLDDPFDLPDGLADFGYLATDGNTFGPTAIYDYALSPGRVRAHFDAAFGASPPPWEPSNTYEQLIASHEPLHWIRLDEQSGASAVDLITGNSLPVSGSASLDEPALIPASDSALALSGGYLDLSSLQSALTGDIVTIMFWLKTNNVNFTFGLKTATQNMYVEIDGNTIFVRAGTGSNWSETEYWRSEGPYTFGDNERYLMAVTFRKSSEGLNLLNVLSDSANVGLGTVLPASGGSGFLGLSSPVSGFYLGNYHSAANRGMTGVIDEVLVFDKTFSGAERTAIRDEALNPQPLTTPQVQATGGDLVYYADGYMYHEFRSSGDFVVTAGGEVEYLVVAGGGGGGTGDNGGGGGGAGGVLQGDSVSVSPGEYEVVVGGGGPGTKGSDSSGFTFVAEGGGRGGNEEGPGLDGGSGGGGGGTSSSSVAQPGGAGSTGGNGGSGSFDSPLNSRRAGGGGGASEDGETATSGMSPAASGGDGITWYGYEVGGGGGGGLRGSDVSGSGGFGGGGSGNASNETAPENGEPNTGGGGGGDARQGASIGGSGIVVVRYPAPAAVLAGGNNVYDSGKYRYHEFTSSGDLTVVEPGVFEYFVVAGGGGGATSSIGGGGGAGGVIPPSSVQLSAGTLPIVVGGGGGAANTGSDSVALEATAFGGGAGGLVPPGSDGGSGGGRNGHGTLGVTNPGGAGVPGQGNDGGGGEGSGSVTRRGGGGGGASEPGADSGSGTGSGVGHGGDGVEVWGYELAGGGAGRTNHDSHTELPTGGLGGGGDGDAEAPELQVATPGSPNTGGGGGASSQPGGSGIVVVRTELPPAQITGGTVTTEDGWEYHTFTSSGDLTVESAGWVEYLVVAGGGGGGTNRGGGGGAGRVVNDDLALSTGTLSIVVGAGGGSSSVGSDSELSTLVVAPGGGRGGDHNSVPGGDGGSGGGGAGSSSANAHFAGDALLGEGLGNRGGDGQQSGTASSRQGGGGGGAGSEGHPYVNNDTPGDGGDPVTLFGLEVGAGGDGGGASDSANGVDIPALAGAPNTGSGGGGGTFTRSGASGGSGIVVVRTRVGE